MELLLLIAAYELPRVSETLKMYPNDAPSITVHHLFRVFFVFPIVICFPYSIAFHDDILFAFSHLSSDDDSANSPFIASIS